MPRQAKKTGQTVVRKARRTFTLSHESVKFLESEKEKRGSESASAVLEEIIHDCRSRGNTNKIDAAISAYYDSLTDEERDEDRLWGQFAESQFPLD